MDFFENYYLNFHAHQQMPAEDEIVIQSKFLQNDLITKNSDKIFFTAGLHPWHAEKLNPDEIKNRLNNLISAKKIIAVGETGLDKIRGAEWKKQLEIFEIQALIAEKNNLPLIIHSVKSHSEVLKLKKDLNSKIPWVIHNFTGSKQIALDFINNGFYLSICYHIRNSNSRISEYLKELPIEKLFLETDDFNVSIKELYKIASEKLNIDIENLKKQLLENLKVLINVS